MIPSEAASGPEPFGKYLLDREIARGGMARVHLARLRGLGGFEKRLVVKQILPALAGDPRFVSMFVEEAKTLVQMSHPHIVPVYELGVVDGVYFLAMEYVEGATLADVLEDGPLDPAEAAHAGAQLCDALWYAHERFSIVHRDVTPRNVMIDAAGHCRLLDFGIAAPQSDEAGGQLFGTPGYLSPEQARGEQLAASSDLFSLGAVLWHALAGRAPLTLDEARALERTGPRLALGGAIDRGLAAIVERALDPDRGARWRDARAMGRALRGWLAQRHPEGVAHELGVRAERARARRDRGTTETTAEEGAAGTAKIARTPARSATPATPLPVPGAAAAKVQTLAQSRALDEIIEGTAPIARRSDPGGAATPVARPSDPGDGTTPIAGRAARLPESTPHAPETHAPDTRPAQSPTRAARSARWRLVATVALVAGGAALAWIAWPPTPPQVPAVDMPTHDAPPRTPRDTEPEPPRLEPRAETEPAPDPEPVAVPAPTAGPSSDPAGAARATLAVTVEGGWARIELDGRTLGTTPIRRAQIRPGVHTIVARNDVLGIEARRRFEVRAGESVHLAVDLDAATIAIRDP